MIRDRAWWFLGFPIALIVSMGCDKGLSANPSATGGRSVSTDASANEVTSALVDASNQKARGMFARHGGIAGSLFRTAHDLDLKEEQKTALAAIEANLKADDEGVGTALKAFRTDLLLAVRTGKFDTAKLGADGAGLDKAVIDQQGKEGGALDSLHALLDAAQRTVLVESVRNKRAERESRMGEWMLAREGDGGAPDWAKKRLDKLTDELVLDVNQQGQVAALFAKSSDPPNAPGMNSRWDDVKRRLEVLLSAFAGEGFDARKMDLTVLPGKVAHEPLDHMVAFFAKLVPILRIDQRDKLAVDLDKPFGFGGPRTRGAAQGRGPADDMLFPFEEPVDTPRGAFLGRLGSPPDPPK